MVDKNCSPLGSAGSNCFKEAVCIDAGRIFDSCSDKDCLEDLQVYFTDAAQPLIDSALNVKCRKVEVLNVYIDTEPVPFNKGFYSVDMTFFFEVKVEIFSSPIAPPTQASGLAIFSKKVILYGSEGSVRVFSSDAADECLSSNNLPKASVQVVDPICLSSRVCDCPSHRCEPTLNVPAAIAERFEGNFTVTNPSRLILVTLGLFSIVQLERSVQMMVPAYDYCVPDKECVSTCDDPCELFKRIKFPVNEFFPPRLSEMDCDDIPSTDC